MNDYSYKLDNYLFPLIENINNPVFLELGVQKGVSTKKFLEICKKKNGKLFSVDVDDCSNILNDINWNFFHTRDDDFDFIKSKIPDKIDVLFIDTIHEASHVQKLFYEYFDIVKMNGYIFIDDISHLPYQKGLERDNFYCEINNKETFQMILDIFNSNKDKFDLNFSFKSSGLCIIKKTKDEKLNKLKKIKVRDISFKNFLRILWKKIKRKS